MQRKVAGRDWGIGLVAVAVYAALSTVLYATAWTSPPQGDQNIFVWFMAWVPYAITHGQNPLLTHHILAPDGVNLLWTTLILLPSFLLTPVTLVFGPIASFWTCVITGVALSSWMMYRATLRFFPSRVGAFIAGLVYGFTPFMFVHSSGHLNLGIALFPPLLLILLDEIVVRQRRNVLAMGALLGGATAAQLLTGEELLAICVVGAFLGIVFACILGRDVVRSRLPYAVRACSVALVVFAVLVAYPVWVQLHDAHEFLGSFFQPPDVYVNDLLTPIVPLPGVSLGGNQLLGISDHFNGAREELAYLGLPLLVALPVLIYIARRKIMVCWAAFLFVAMLVLSFGPELQIAGQRTNIPLPWALVQNRGLFADILPARFSVLIFFSVSLIVAGAIDAMRTWRLVRKRWAVAGLAACFIPLVPLPTSMVRTPTIPTFFAVGAPGIPAESVVLVDPIAIGGATQAMTWQAVSGMRFKMTSGVWTIPLMAAFLQNGGIQPALFRIDSGEPPPVLTPELRSAMRSDLQNLGVNIIIADEHGRAAIGFISSVLGRQPEYVQGVAVWTVPILSTS